MFGRARLRLALWYAGALAVILVAVGGTAYLILRHELDGEVDDSLSVAARDLLTRPAPVLLGEAPGGNGEPPGGDGDDHSPGGREPSRTIATDVFYLVLKSDGTVLSNPRGIELEGFPLASLARDAAAGSTNSDFNGPDHHYRVVAAPLAASGGSGAAALVVGRSLDARDYQLKVLAYVLAVGGFVGVVFAALGGFWIAGRALVPIRRALETQRQFVSDASHELRTPVAVVKANAELVLRHPHQTVEANADQVVAINEEADHMAKLVGDLLTLARADEQRLTLERAPLNLDELLDGLVRDMTALAEAKGVALSADLSAGRVDGDAQRLRQLGAILLDNAVKFTPAGGTVRVRSWRDGSRSVFSVTDTGPGVALEDQPHIFDRFYRSDRARSSEGGTGLGLAIARWIAEAHGGRVTVESTPGRGATLVVRLPARHRA